MWSSMFYNFTCTLDDSDYKWSKKPCLRNSDLIPVPRFIDKSVLCEATQYAIYSLI